MRVDENSFAHLFSPFLSFVNIRIVSTGRRIKISLFFQIKMGKQVRSNAQKSKVKQPKQQKQQKKAKAVKTNLKRLNERVRDKVEKLDQIYDQKEEKPIEKK